MIPTDTIRRADWHAVHDGPKGPRGEQYPCVVCGRGCDMDTSPLVRLHGGGALIVTEEEAAQLNAAGREAEDMGAYPVGRDCLRRVPALLRYVEVDHVDSVKDTGSEPAMPKSPSDHIKTLLRDESDDVIVVRLSEHARRCLNTIKRGFEGDEDAFNRILSTLLASSPDFDHFYGAPRDGRGPSGE